MMLMLTCPQIIVIAKLIAHLDEWFWSYIESDLFIMFSVASKMLLFLPCDFSIRCLWKDNCLSIFCAAELHWSFEYVKIYVVLLGIFFLCVGVCELSIMGIFTFLGKEIPSELGSWFFFKKKKEKFNGLIIELDAQTCVESNWW